MTNVHGEGRDRPVRLPSHEKRAKVLTIERTVKTDMTEWPRLIRFEPRYEKTGIFAYAKTKTHISFAADQRPLFSLHG